MEQNWRLIFLLSCLLNFFRILGNSYSLSFFFFSISQRSYVGMFLFLWNLKMVCKSPHKYKISYWCQFFFQLEISFTVRNVCGLTWIKCLTLKQTKSENNSFPDHLLFCRLWHIRSFIHSSWILSVVLVLMLVETGFDIHIFNYILPFFYKSRMISIIYYK